MIDWQEFRDQFAVLRAWVRKWDHLFVLNEPSSQAECYAAVEEHRQEIDWLREGIEDASDNCKAYLDEHIKPHAVFVQLARPEIDHLSHEMQRKILAVRAGNFAIAAAKRLVERSFCAETYPDIDWEWLHVPRDTRDVLKNCKIALANACWVLLPDVDDRFERIRLAQRMSAKLRPALGESREKDGQSEQQDGRTSRRPRKDSPSADLIAAVMSLREKGIKGEDIPTQLRRQFPHLVPADAIKSWPSESTQRRWQRESPKTDDRSSCRSS